MAGRHLGRVMQRLRRSLERDSDRLDDSALLRRYAEAREEQAFTTLVERYGPMVWGVCRRVLGHEADADDAFQATFLVLACKAGAPFWQESIAGWLYQVAYRTASQARLQAARRRRHEHAAGGRPQHGGSSPELWELQRALDEELSGLPERYRLPIVLCSLQDQTTDEVARQLGWSFNAVKGRLQRGREMLRQRLEKRGVTLSAGIVATLLTEGAGDAAPYALMTSTVEAARTGAKSSAVAALVKGVCLAMYWKKLRIALAVLVAGTIFGIGGGIGLSRWDSARAVETDKSQVKGNEQGKVGQPASKDALELVIRPTQAVYPVGKVPTFDVTCTNREDKTYEIHGGITLWKCVATGGEPLVCRPDVLDFKVQEVKPGKSWTQAGVPMPGPFVGPEPRLGDKVRDNHFQTLPTGRYRVAAQVELTEKQRRKYRIVLTSDPVDIVIGEAKKEHEAEKVGSPFLPASKHEPTMETTRRPTISALPLAAEPKEWVPNSVQIFFSAKEANAALEYADKAAQTAVQNLDFSKEKLVLVEWLSPYQKLAYNLQIGESKNYILTFVKTDPTGLIPGLAAPQSRAYFVVPASVEVRPTLKADDRKKAEEVKKADDGKKPEDGKKPVAVTDPSTGYTVRLSADKKSLEAIDSTGKLRWKQQIFSDNGRVIEQFGVVRIWVQSNRINKSNATAEVEIRTGAVKKGPDLQ